MKYKCQYCQKIFETKQSLGGHVRRCKLNPKNEEIINNWKKSNYGENHITQKKLNHNKKHICKFCNLEFDSGFKLGGHTAMCLKNPNAKYTREKITKLKYGKKHSKETKLKIKNSMIKAVKEGRQKTPKPGGITYTKYIKNIFNEEHLIQGSWEEKFCIFLNDKKVHWIRNKVGFKYQFENNERTYFPDFYLPDFNIYIEVKGYETSKDKAKFSQFPFKLLIVRKNEIENLNQWFRVFNSEIEYPTHNRKVMGSIPIGPI